MSFFNDSTATTLQLISTPLEALGLLMIYAEAFNQWLLNVFKKSLSLWHAFFSRYLSRYEEITVDYARHAYWSYIPALSMFFIIFMFFYHPGDIFFEKGSKPAVAVNIIFPLFYGYFVLSLTFSYLTIRTNRPLISMGLILSGLGLIGELYQVCTIWWGS